MCNRVGFLLCCQLRWKLLCHVLLLDGWCDFFYRGKTVKLKRTSITVQVKRSPKTYAKHSLSGYLVTYAFVSGVELQVVCSLCQIMETGIKILDYPHFHVLVNFYVIFFYYASYLVVHVAMVYRRKIKDCRTSRYWCGD
jgi:hypothetical protein